MKDTFCRNKHNLHIPLGKWHQQADSQQWETYVEHKIGYLIRQQEVAGLIHYTSYKPHPITQHIAYTKNRGKEVNKPSTMYRISMHSESPKSWVFNKPGNSNIQQGIPSPLFLTNQEDAVVGQQCIVIPSQGSPLTKTNLQILKRMQGPVQENGSRKHLAAALKKGKLLWASDDTVKDGKGAHAWIITTTRTKNFTHNIQGSGPVDGNLKSMNSTRAERAGLLGPLINTLGLAQDYQLTEGTLHMNVDNMGSYSKGNASKRGESTFKYVIQDYDYKLHKSSLEFKLQQDYNSQVEYYYVKAHQDEKPQKTKRASIYH